jgi:hypothetical protein
MCGALTSDAPCLVLDMLKRTAAGWLAVLLSSRWCSTSLALRVLNEEQLAGLMSGGAVKL